MDDLDRIEQPQKELFMKQFLMNIILSVYKRAAVIRSIYRIVRTIFSRYWLKGLIKQRLKEQSPIKAVLGAGGKFLEGYIPTEIYSLNILKPEDWNRYFPKESIDVLLAEHLWEHLSREEGIFAAKMCFKYLKPGGHLRVAVPDGFFPDPRYIERVKPGGIGGVDHKILYNHKSLKEVLEIAGFKVDLLEYYDEDGRFHSKDWSNSDGIINRSRKLGMSERKFGDLQYSSLMLDAIKVG